MTKDDAVKLEHQRVPTGTKQLRRKQDTAVSKLEAPPLPTTSHTKYKTGLFHRVQTSCMHGKIHPHIDSTNSSGAMTILEIVTYPPRNVAKYFNPRTRKTKTSMAKSEPAESGKGSLE